ncbi:MAG: glycosyltransferase family 4 protein [Spirochaetia bacterium]
MHSISKKHIGFISTRFAGTDGVSLESTKWAHYLESIGHSCYWYAGQLDKPEDRSMLVPEAFFNTPENIDLNSRLFGTQQRSRDTTDEIQRKKEFFKDSILDFIRTFELDVLIAQNCLAIPMHIPLGLALSEVITENGIPVIAHHHDFWWERPRFLLNSIPDVLATAFPPDLPSIRHVVISSMIQKELASRRGISASVIPNVIDFDSPLLKEDDFNRSFREDFGFTEDDILILQPTRVVSRKGIEQALYLVKQLSLPKAKLLISHSAGDEGPDYFEWIMETARQQDIPVYFLFNRVNETRKYNEKGEKLYTLWDIYPHVDLITYPSLYEGFGNAFLEAIYFKKPILVNRYSVYIVDIEPKGFDVVSIDGFLTKAAVSQVREVLQNPERKRAMVEKNFEIGKRYFSTLVMEQNLSNLLTNIFGNDI